MNIAFVPVRGGSKGIHLKNVRNVCGVPLLQHTLYTLEKSEDIDLIVVATDDYEIYECARAFGSTKIIIYDREAENAEDTSSTESVMLEYFEKHLHWLGSKVFLVQVTNPFLREEHIAEAVEVMDGGVDSVVTVTKDHRFLWDSEGQALNYTPDERPRRQDWDGIYIENGAMYGTFLRNLSVSKCRISGAVHPLVMEGKHTQIEIDEMEDLLITETLLYREGQRLAKVKQRSRSV